MFSEVKIRMLSALFIAWFAIPKLPFPSYGSIRVVGKSYAVTRIDHILVNIQVNSRRMIAGGPFITKYGYCCCVQKGYYYQNPFVHCMLTLKKLERSICHGFQSAETNISKLLEIKKRVAKNCVSGLCIRRHLSYFRNIPVSNTVHRQHFCPDRFSAVFAHVLQVCSRL